MKILSRYILREHVPPFAAAVGLLTGLLLLNQLAKKFGELVGKGLPWHVIAEVFGLSMPFIVAMTMPMAVLVAVLYTFSRLSGDNEVTAIKAGGVSMMRLLVPVLLAATAVATGMIWFNDNVLPESNHALRRLLTDISRKQPTFELRERVVNEVAPGKFFLQTARIDRSRSILYDLVIFDLGRRDAQRTIYADSGHMAFNESQTDLFLTLYDGSMHELDWDDRRTDQRTYYRKQVIRVPGITNELERGASSDWRGDREMSIAMMQAEIRSRRDELRQLEDSVTSIIARLQPPAATSPGAREPAVWDGDDGVSLKRKKLRGAMGAGTSPRSQDQGQTTARPTDIGEVKTRNIRPNIGSGLEWPPPDPLRFAIRVRSEFQQAATRKEIHQREINRYGVEIQKKFAIPVAAIVFVLIGAPIGVKFPRGGIGTVIGVSLGVFIVYYACLIGGEKLADRDIVTPFWAMWAPNVLFTLIGAALLYHVSHSGAKGEAGVVGRIARRLLVGESPARAGEDAA